jgi:pimeloyl-ACP methyl ester carboxylesterase
MLGGEGGLQPVVHWEVCMSDSKEVATIVLVHGWCCGAWVWDRLVPLLHARGLPTRALDLPCVIEAPQKLCNLHDDARAVRSVIDELRTPVVLCGHSYGGVVITEASADQPRVRHLVYIAAEIPDEKETTVTYAAYSNPEFMETVLFRDDGTGLLDPETTPLFWDCDPEVRDWARSRLRPMSMRIADPDQTPTGMGWREHPSTLLVCQQDETASAEYFTVYAQRATRVIELPTGHSPQLSRPEMVADILEQVARS